MKKLLAIFIAVLMCATLFAACGSNDATRPADAPSTDAPAEDAAPADDAAPAEEEQTPAEDAPSDTVPVEEMTKLVLGLDASFPPMGFTDQDNNIIGVDIDLAKEVCTRLGIEFEAKPIDWATKEMELDTGKIDVIWNGMTVTDERKEAFELSRSYMNNTQVIVVMNDSTIASKADLADKVVAAQTDSSGESVLMADEIYASIKDGAHKQYADYVTALNDLALGRIDAIVMDEVVARYYIEQNAQPMTVLEETLSPEEYAIAAKKGRTDLIEAIDKTLDEMQADGTLDKISLQWFGKEGMILR